MSFYTQKLLYTHTFLHTEVFTQRALTRGNFHTHTHQFFLQRSHYTEKHLHREVFTQRRLYTKWKVEIGSNSLGNTLRRGLREQAFPTCSKKKQQITTKFQFHHHSMNMFKKE